jgi:hypothetical protein
MRSRRWFETGTRRPYARWTSWSGASVAERRSPHRSTERRSDCAALDRFGPIRAAAHVGLEADPAALQPHHGDCIRADNRRLQELRRGQRADQARMANRTQTIMPIRSVDTRGTETRKPTQDLSSTHNNHVTRDAQDSMSPLKYNSLVTSSANLDYFLRGRASMTSVQVAIISSSLRSPQRTSRDALGFSRLAVLLSYVNVMIIRLPFGMTTGSLKR